MYSALWPILRKAIRHLRRVAVIDDQRRWRYLDLVGGALHLARRLDRDGASRHVGVLLPTSGAFAMTLLAVWMTRRVIVPVNYLLNAEERQYIVDHCETNTVITAGLMLEFLGDAPRNVNLLKLDELSFKGLPPLRLPPIISGGGSETAAILYTSGTSGRPKGVVLTHRNLRSNVEAAIAHIGLTESNGFLGVLPQFHSFGLTALTLLPLYLGARVIYSARFVPAKLVKLVAEHKPDVFMAIPSMYTALARVKEAGPDDLASIRLAVSGAEPLPQSTYDAFAQRFNINILEGYGLTETSPVVSWLLPFESQRGSVGTALPGVELRIAPGEGMAAGEGEILVRGPNIMAGYFKQDDLTREVIDAEGYFRTGDIGRIDERGRLYITGRLKEMMIIGGENVFPREIEEAMLKHPSVKSVAVIGRMDPTRGEVPVAFIELADGAKFDEQALRTHCRELIAGFKVPREIRVVEQLPRSPTGKIIRRKLADLIEKD